MRSEANETKRTNERCNEIINESDSNWIFNTHKQHENDEGAREERERVGNENKNVHPIAANQPAACTCFCFRFRFFLSSLSSFTRSRRHFYPDESNIEYVCLLYMQRIFSIRVYSLFYSVIMSIE